MQRSFYVDSWSFWKAFVGLAILVGGLWWHYGGG